MWLLTNQKPNHQTALSAALVSVGAVVAGWDSIDTDWFGFLLVWMNNFTQSVSNLITSSHRFSHISAFGKLRSPYE